MADATGRYTVYSVGHYRQRLDDLMFTLHFMDYTGTGFFNHPLIVIFAIATSLLTLSGGYLLISRSGPTGQQQALPCTLTVNFVSGAESASLQARADDTVFNALSRHGIHLPQNAVVPVLAENAGYNAHEIHQSPTSSNITSISNNSPTGSVWVVSNR